ncbi:hypothetical protein L2E82_37446 [Cichorium intybus]|uniref:Uncharacterized protein n=1 Tax=Cichorium intybus TaxID=13427 RepID=A0ACB9AIL9_CICIN|nr:hypothetical protein L2E82_37446 [Cichorium intybus]
MDISSAIGKLRIHILVPEKLLSFTNVLIFFAKNLKSNSRLHFSRPYLLYFDAVECEAVKLARKNLVIRMWTTDDLENKEKEEFIAGGFGLCKLVDDEEVIDDLHNRGTTSVSDEEGPSIRFDTIEEQTKNIPGYGVIVKKDYVYIWLDFIVNGSKSGYILV